jgi:hypothetical protein
VRQREASRASNLPGRWWVRVLGAALIWGAALGASGSAPEEYALKAAYLYNFVKYIQWPAESFAAETDPYRVCVVGKDPFGEQLRRAVEGKTVRNRSFVLQYFERAGGELRLCHLLFVSGDEALETAVLKSVGDRSIVTVGEQSFARRGGVASFVRTPEGFTVELNVDAARARQLRVSARLQQVTSQVSDETVPASP